MSETVHNVTDLPVKPNSLRKFAIRTMVLAAAGTVVAVVISQKLKSNEENENAETTQA